MRRSLLAPFASATLLFLSANAGAGMFDDEEARKQVAEARRRIEDINAQLDARLSALEATVRSKGLLDLFTQVEGIRSDIANLRGQLEVLRNDIDTTQKRQRDLYVDIDTRMRKVESMQQQQAAALQAVQTAAAVAAVAAVVPGTVLPPPGAPAATPPATAGSAGGIDPSAAPVPPPGAMVPGVSTTPPAATLSSPLALSRPGVAAAADAVAEQRAYDAALDQFKSGNYGASLQSFVNFVRMSPRSPLAPSAQYWVGNAHYALKDYKSAIASQRQLMNTYPDSQKVPDAMLNISSSQIELGDTTGARRTLDDLVARYPASEAADRAKKRLPGAR